MRTLLFSTLLVALASNGFAYINGSLPGESRADYESRIKRGGRAAEQRAAEESMQRFREEEERYSAAVLREPDNASARYQRGLFYLRNISRQHRNAAHKDFSEAIRLDPSFARAYYARSFCYRDDLYGGGFIRRDLDQAVALDPDFVPALLARSDIYAREAFVTYHEKCSGLESAERARAVAGDDKPRVLCVLAAAYAAVGDFERAAQWAEKAAALTLSVPGSKKGSMDRDPREILAAYRAGRNYQHFAGGGLDYHLRPERVFEEFGLK